MIEPEQRTARFGTIDNYTAHLFAPEQQELVAAKIALVVGDALEQARRKRGPRAAVTLPVSAGDVDLELLGRYLRELGHDVRFMSKRMPHGGMVKVAPRKSGRPRYRRPRLRRLAPAQP